MPFQAGPTTPVQEPRSPRERTREPADVSIPVAPPRQPRAPREETPEPTAGTRPTAPAQPPVAPRDRHPERADVPGRGPTPADRPGHDRGPHAVTSATPPRPDAPVTPPARDPVAAAVVPVVVGRRFQPVPGGALPRPHPSDPLMAALLATPAAPVFAVTEGTVRRAPAQVAAGAVELRAPDGSALVLLGGPSVAWVVDDEESVGAGAVLGIVAGSPGDPPGEPLLVLAVDASGSQVDAVALLVGLPDPGELDLLGADSAVGVDPYRLDLELAATLQTVGEVP